MKKSNASLSCTKCLNQHELVNSTCGLQWIQGKSLPCNDQLNISQLQGFTSVIGHQYHHLRLHHFVHVMPTCAQLFHLLLIDAETTWSDTFIVTNIPIRPDGILDYLSDAIEMHIFIDFTNINCTHIKYEIVHFKCLIFAKDAQQIPDYFWI